MPDEQEVGHWTIRGDNSTAVDQAVLARLTGQAPSLTRARGEKLLIVWPNAQLEADGRSTLRLRVEIRVTVGHTMHVGSHTPYSGLITKVDDAVGRIVDLKSGRAFLLRLSERGTWAGRLIHSESHGSDHLAVEFPFSLFDERTKGLVAQNKLLGRFDLSDRARPFIPVLRLSPTEFSDLRQQTVDLGRAIEARTVMTSTPAGRCTVR